MKLALVHDDFCQMGGAERLFAEIARIYPYAPIYTSLVNWSKLPESINKDRIHTSFMQKIPFAANFYKLLLPLYSFAFESFDLSEFDLVISSTTRFAKSIITKPNTTHVCYINSVPRFLYHQNTRESYLPSFLQILTKPLLNWLKHWDKVAANRVDLYIANSKNVQNSVKYRYNRQSLVVHPFADTDYFKPSQNPKTGNYFLVVSRLVKWKRLDIAIDAAKDLDINLKIVGSGPDKKRLKKLAKTNISFIQNLTQKEILSLYQNAKALIVTQEEDFGIAMVEAQSCGIPIIAYKAGGALEIVIDGKTGIFFNNQSAESLKDAIIALSRLKYDISQIRENGLRFGRSHFKKELEVIVTNYAGHY